MNVNQKIENALKDISENIWPLYCPEDSPPEKYIVYNPEMEKPELYADDTDLEWTQYMQVHLYMKGNYLTEKSLIRNALRDAGFVITNIETLYEKDSGYTHLCFECYIGEVE